MKNIIFIVVDTLRYRNLGCYGYPYETSPTIDKLAELEESTRFNSAYTTSTNTDPAFTSFMTGLSPINHGVINHANEVTKSEINTAKKRINLPQVLRKKGYNTYGLDFLGRWHKKGFDYYMGLEDPSKRLRNKIIDKFRDIFGIHPGSKIQNLIEGTRLYDFIFSLSVKDAPYKTADKLTNKSIEILENNKDNNKFIFLHYWEPHQPYIKREDYLSLFKKHDYDFYSIDTNYEEVINSMCDPKLKNFLKLSTKGYDDIKDIIRLYDSEVRYLDDQIKRIYNCLKEINQFKDSLIIITADHGETFLEHNNYFSHESLYNEVFKIPLIMTNFNLDESTIKKNVQSIDIMPTILTHLGIKIEKPIDGVNLHGRIPPERDIFGIKSTKSQTIASLISGDFKYITSLNKGIKCKYCKEKHLLDKELFNIRKDPNERNNLVGNQDYLETKNKLSKKLDNRLNTTYEKRMIKKIL